MISLEAQTGIEFGVWRADIESSVIETSDFVMLRPDSRRTTVAIYTEGRAYVEYSVSTPSELNSDTAEWIKWPLGNVRRNSADGIISTVTAVRLVNLRNHDAKMEVVSQ